MTVTPQEDASAIALLIAKVAYVSDEGPLEDYAHVWSQDAELVFGADTQQGLAKILAAAAERREAGTLGPGSGIRHIVTPVSILLDGESATAVTYLQVLTTKTPQPTLVYLMIYDDEFVRSPDGWRIKRRCARMA
jgi:hypothetical protein